MYVCLLIYEKTFYLKWFIPVKWNEIKSKLSRMYNACLLGADHVSPHATPWWQHDQTRDIRGRDTHVMLVTPAPAPPPWSLMSLIASGEMWIVSHYVTRHVSPIIGASLRAMPADRITGDYHPHANLLFSEKGENTHKYSGSVFI